MTKKIKIALLMLAAVFAATLLTGCSGNDFVEEIELEERPIEFSSSTKNATRAGEATPEANKWLADNGGFYVWGWKAKTASPMNWADGLFQVFDKVKVYSNSGDGAYISGDETNWTYESKRYWDRKSTYCFYAAGPAGANAKPVAANITLAGSSADAKHFEINNVPSLSSNAASCNDFVITREKVTRDGSINTNVDFTFHHIMSKVALKFKAGVDGCAISITDVKITGWSNAQYNFIQNLNYAGGTNMSEWATSEANKAGIAEFVKPTSSFGNNAKDSEDADLPTEVDADSYWIMVPQSVANLKFTVSYTITYSDGVTDTFKNVEATLTNQNWYTDCCTTYTLTISPNPIKFNVTSVSWTGSTESSVIVQ